MGPAEGEGKSRRPWDQLRGGGHGPRRRPALTREDAGADEEQRFVTLGLSDVGTLLVVVYVCREPDTVRVISAWRANTRQRVLYEKGRR